MHVLLIWGTLTLVIAIDKNMNYAWKCFLRPSPYVSLLSKLNRVWTESARCNDVPIMTLIWGLPSILSNPGIHLILATKWRGLQEIVWLLASKRTLSIKLTKTSVAQFLNWPWGSPFRSIVVIGIVKNASNSILEGMFRKYGYVVFWSVLQGFRSASVKCSFLRDYVRSLHWRKCS